MINKSNEDLKNLQSKNTFEKDLVREEIFEEILLADEQDNLKQSSFQFSPETNSFIEEIAEKFPNKYKENINRLIEEVQEESWKDVWVHPKQRVLKSNNLNPKKNSYRI